MSCNDFLPLLEEYADGELNGRNAAKLESHLATCPQCAAELDVLKRELDVYARYDRAIEVSPALWQSVAARIEPSSGGPARVASRGAGLKAWFLGGAGAPRFSPAMALALVLLAVAVTVLVMRYNGRQPSARPEEVADRGPVPSPTPMAPNESQGAAPGTTGARTPAPPAPGVGTRAARNRENKATPPTAEELVRRAEQGYIAAINILSKDVNRNKSTLDPAVLARFEAALGSINRTIAETRQAVRQNPGDALAVQYMQTAYSDKVELLKEMAGAQ